MAAVSWKDLTGAYAMLRYPRRFIPKGRKGPVVTEEEYLLGCVSLRFLDYLGDLVGVKFFNHADTFIDSGSLQDVPSCNTPYLWPRSSIDEEDEDEDRTPLRLSETVDMSETTVCLDDANTLLHAQPRNMFDGEDTRNVRSNTPQPTSPVTGQKRGRAESSANEASSSRPSRKSVRLQNRS
jgi:hypothetical protein